MELILLEQEVNLANESGFRILVMSEQGKQPDVIALLEK